MSANNSVPYGVKSLLECVSRATLLAQPDNIPEFLSTHVDKMTHFRDKDSRDTKEVAFRYQEQWENIVLQEESKRTKTLRTAPEESPSPTSSVSSTSSASLTVSPPREVRRRTRRVSSVRIPSQQEAVGLTSEEVSPTSPPRPASPPRGERVKKCRVSSVRIPRQQEAVGLTSEEVSPTSPPRPAPPPRGERVKTRRVSSVRIPRQQEAVGLTSEEVSPTSPPRPAPPPRGERVKKCRVSSVRIPRQKETKPSLPSAWPVLPPIPQKAPSHVSKQVQGQKPTKGRGSGVYICHLNDCPYHNTPKEGSAVDRELGPVRTSTGSTVKRDLGLQKSLAGPGSFELRVPYKPKGGFIVDPELVPKRTRAGLETKRTTGTESSLLYGGQGTVYARQDIVSEGTNRTNLSQVTLECSTHTCTGVTHSVHIISNRCMHVQCSELQPHSARLRNIALQPNLESQLKQEAKSSTPCDPIRNSSAMGKSPYSYFSDWNRF